jgi:hypothetical protein
VGVGFLLFSLAVRYLNVMEPSPEHKQQDTGSGIREKELATRA